MPVEKSKPLAEAEDDESVSASSQSGRKRKKKIKRIESGAVGIGVKNIQQPVDNGHCAKFGQNIYIKYIKSLAC